MTRPRPVLYSAIDQPAADGIPDWLHLLPAVNAHTANGRGPYRARLTARDPVLAAGFFANLEATNRAATTTAHHIARRCMAMLRAA